MVASRLKQGLCIAVLIGMGAVGPAQAQFDPVDEVLETMGLKSRQREQIDYRERPPLVVPPKTGALRPPEQAASERNARWPQDPDVNARKRRAAEGRVPNGIASEQDPSQGGLVREGEGRKRNAYAGVPTRGGASAGGEGSNPATMLTPSQVGQILASSSETAKPSGVEPDRQYLTEPPKGYRRAAAGAAPRSTVEPMRSDGDSIQINALRPAN